MRPNLRRTPLAPALILLAIPGLWGCRPAQPPVVVMVDEWLLPAWQLLEPELRKAVAPLPVVVHSGTQAFLAQRWRHDPRPDLWLGSGPPPRQARVLGWTDSLLCVACAARPAHWALPESGSYARVLLQARGTLPEPRATQLQPELPLRMLQAGLAARACVWQSQLRRARPLPASCTCLQRLKSSPAWVLQRRPRSEIEAIIALLQSPAARLKVAKAGYMP